MLAMNILVSSSQDLSENTYIYKEKGRLGVEQKNRLANDASVSLLYEALAHIICILGIPIAVKMAIIFNRKSR